MTFSASSTSASDDSLALSMDEERETTPADDRKRIIQLGRDITGIMQERVSDITHACIAIDNYNVKVHYLSVQSGRLVLQQCIRPA